MIYERAYTVVACITKTGRVIESVDSLEFHPTDRSDKPLKCFIELRTVSMKYRWQYDAASATAEFHDGLCVVDLRGLMTADAISELSADIQKHMVTPTYVVVCCWDKSVLAVEVGDGDKPGENPIRVPVVNVVSSGERDAFERHADNMIRYGLLRITTLSLDAALGWAARKAVVSEWSQELRLTGQLLAPVSPARARVRSPGRRHTARL